MQRQKPLRIDENTLIPVSLLIVVIGFVFWLATLHSKVNASEKELEKLNCTVEGCLRYQIAKQGESLARIEGALNIKKVEKE